MNQELFNSLLDKYKENLDMDENTKNELINKMCIAGCAPDKKKVHPLDYSEEDYDYQNLKRCYDLKEIKECIKECIGSDCSSVIVTNKFNVDEVLFNSLDDVNSDIKDIINDNIIRERLTNSGDISLYMCRGYIKKCKIYFSDCYIEITMDDKYIFYINGFKSIQYDNYMKILELLKESESKIIK